MSTHTIIHLHDVYHSLSFIMIMTCYVYNVVNRNNV